MGAGVKAQQHFLSENLDCPQNLSFMSQACLLVGCEYLYIYVTALLADRHQMMNVEVHCELQNSGHM